MPIRQKLWEEFNKIFSEKIPQPLQPVREEIQSFLHNAFQQACQNLHIVTYDEFAVQEKILARTREKLEMLEAKMTELEEFIKEK